MDAPCDVAAFAPALRLWAHSGQLSLQGTCYRAPIFCLLPPRMSVCRKGGCTMVQTRPVATPA
eukprot:2899362-Pyramimonas_sp.AAC.1